MLTKALLTGGVLSVLAGSIVYFGTEGADASEANARASMRVEETELAGAPAAKAGNIAAEKSNAKNAEDKSSWFDKSETKQAEDDMAEVNQAGVENPNVQEIMAENTSPSEANFQGPPPDTSKPKTKWLDQYLKKTKPEKRSEETVEEKPSETDMSIATPYEIEPNSDEGEGIVGPAAAFDDALADEYSAETSATENTDLWKSDPSDRPVMRMEKRNALRGLRGEENETLGASEDSRFETFGLDDPEIDAFDLYAWDEEGDVDIDALLEELNGSSEERVEVRIIKKIDGKSSHHAMANHGEAEIDYDMILDEAKKLLVTDMRNQAFLEIIDHAIDQGDVMRAADIVEDLSTPELRDTARARIGVGLARSGDQRAAFAVLDELEIDELSAPIRLEIITALMATKQERNNFGPQR